MADVEYVPPGDVRGVSDSMALRLAILLKRDPKTVKIIVRCLRHPEKGRFFACTVELDGKYPEEKEIDLVQRYVASVSIGTGTESEPLRFTWVKSITEVPAPTLS